jgi:hypothetical protein
LSIDWAKKDRVCENCPVVEVLEDGFCGMCKYRELDQTYTPEWRAWIDNLLRLWAWSEAGYRIEDELEFEDWQALAVIGRHYKMKDLAELAKAMGGGGGS